MYNITKDFCPESETGKHHFKHLSKDECRLKNIKLQGIPAWECENCGFITYSM